MEDISCRILRSRRKTLSLEIHDGGVIVRAPFFASEARIRKFIEEHRGWIEKHLRQAETVREAAAEAGKLSEGELKALAEKAKNVIPERAAFYAPLIGVSYGRITIRAQHTRWGSCSAQRNLNFNCLLMLAPPEVIDSVVVHELCHIKEMNHSRRFYAEVLRVFPEYRRWNRWLAENGPVLLGRLPDPEEREFPETRRLQNEICNSACDARIGND